MRRNDRIVIRLNEVERRAILRLAKAERLPPSTAARRILLDVAEALKVEARDDQMNER